MNTLDRYLFRTVLLYALMAMGVLLTLGGLFIFISEQGDIGVGSYTALDAFMYTLLNLPQQAFQMLPIGAMIGALMGLGNLASGSELVVTRASGMSIWRVAWPVGLAGAMLALSMYLIGEYAAPPLSQFAQTEKTTSRLADVSFAGRSSAWIKEGNMIMRLRTGEVGQAFGGVELFELEGPDRLQSIRTAERVSVADPGRWRLENVRTTTFASGRVEAARTDHATMRSTINPDFLGLAATDPELLTLRGLAGYIEHLKRNHLQTAPYEIGFWSRVARIFSVVVVTLLSLPFVFGPLRATGTGTRTVIGVLLGVVFFVINGTVEKGGQLFGLNPIVTGWLPTAVIGLGTIVAISRTR